MKYIFVMLVSSLIFCNATFSQWVQTPGPEGGSVRAIAYSDSSIYIGCINYGGIYKSTDSGNNWVNISQSLSISNNDVRAIIKRNNIIYAGTGNGIVKSNDEGNSWQTLFSSSSVQSICFNENYIFAAVSGVKLSSDNGTTWINANNGLTNTSVNYIKIYDSKLYAGTFGGLFLSTNNGSSWNLISQTLPFNIINDFEVRNDTIFAATSGGGVYMSADNGNIWRHISQETIYTNPTVITTKGNKLFAPFFGDGLYSTTNNGLNWTMPESGFPERSLVYTLSAKDNLLFAGFIEDGIYRSTDEGENWQKSSKGLFATSIYSLEKCDRGILAGTTKGIYITTDLGISWESASWLNSCYSISTIKKVDNVIYAGSNNGCGLWKSYDEGFTWDQSNNGLGYLNINAITANEFSVFLATNDGVYYSDTEGSIWNRINNLPITDFYTVKAMNSYLFAATNDSIYKSTDNGVSWLKVGIPYIKNFESLGSKYYAAGLFGVYISTNNGNSWYSSNSGLSNTATEALIKNGNYLILSSTFSGNYYSSNAGQSWVHLNANLSAKTTSLLALNNIIYAGTQGKGVYKFDFNTVGINEVESNTPVGYSLSQNYPNPFNPSTKINFSLLKSGNVSLKVYDVSGKTVATLVNEKLSAGVFEYEFNGAGLSSGIYFYRIMADEFVETKRMILIK